MKTPEKILTAFRKEKVFLLSVHVSPDGDAIGSAVALSMALDSLGKKSFIYSSDPVPKYYRFLPGHERVLSGLRDAVALDPALVLLDCNTPARAALDNVSFRRSIVVDHHETEKDFGDVKWIDHKAAATGLMVYSLIKGLGARITEDIAVNLYTAIAVDTGTFRYSNTSPEVLRACAELVDRGADPNLVSVSLYETWERKRFDLLVTVLNTLEIKSGVAVTHVTGEMFRKTGAKPEDTDTFSNFPRMIRSVKISALFREVGAGEWKVSLRSKGDVNVARIAELFGGGGHRNAAGCRIKADLATAKESLLKAVRTNVVKSKK
jgi:bifunctional oligoribonuclease and PAP phosphatase NrnA